MTQRDRSSIASLTADCGCRSRDWIKTKNIRMQIVVVGGWTAGQGRRTGAIGSLLLGILDPPGSIDLTTGGGLR